MNSKRMGFTLIEVTVVVIIVGILTTVASVQVIRTQIVARDKERENDVKIIAGVLEEIHKTGQINGAIIPTNDVNVPGPVPMGYPGRNLIVSPNDNQTKAILGAIDPNALKSPLKKAMSFTYGSDTGITGPNTASGRTIAANSTDDIYVYETMVLGDSMCTNANPDGVGQSVIAPQYAPSNPAFDSCVLFNIYYYSEATNSIKVLASKDRTIPNGL